MANEPFDPELDDLLKDVRRLIDADSTPPAEKSEEFYFDELLEGAPLPEATPEEKLDFAGLLDDVPEDPAPAPPPPQNPRWTDKQKVPRHVAQLQHNQQQAYADWLYTQEHPAGAAEPDIQQTRWTERQKVPRHVARLQQNQEQAYADWLYEQDRRGVQAAPALEDAPVKTAPKRKKARQAEPSEELPAQMPKQKKKRHGFRNFLIFLVVLALALTAAVVFLLPRQPVADTGLGQRKDGVSTILLVGTDAGGSRTDTLMLLTANRAEGALSLVSIPRDTLVNGPYSVPKINSVYGANNGGDEGIEMLLTRVAQCIGFRPDGYLLVRLDAFVEFVDILGGVEFDVPVDMYYNDPSQDLYIALESGRQLLTGEQAMGLVRFRSGYTDADLGRVQVQRAFLSALIDQAVSVRGVAASPRLLQLLRGSTQTDLTAGNLLWLAETALLADRSNIETATLPGSARTIGDGSYYVLDPASVAQTVNTYCSPYERAVTTDDLEIRQG